MQMFNRLKKEAEVRGENVTMKLRRHLEMDNYDRLHWQRSLEEREALIRDISWYFLLLIFQHDCDLLKVF